MVFAGAVPTAAADSLGAINGVFTAVSNGEWARTNEVYRAEQTVVSTWTVSTSCSMYNVCEGQLSSDQGWTSAIATTSGMWHVRRALPDWLPCTDGSSAPAEQSFRFYPIDIRNGQLMMGSDTFTGVDRTVGVGGACGVNTPKVIEMPFRLTRQA